MNLPAAKLAARTSVGASRPAASASVGASGPAARAASSVLVIACHIDHVNVWSS